MSKKNKLEEIISELEHKAREYFGTKGLEPEKISIMRGENSITVTVPATAFDKDERILDMGSYSFLLSVTRYEHTNIVLGVSLSVWLKFKKGMVEKVNSDNLAIFDDFASYLGFYPEEKSVALNANVIDGEVIYSGDGEVIWWGRRRG